MFNSSPTWAKEVSAVSSLSSSPRHQQTWLGSLLPSSFKHSPPTYSRYFLVHRLLMTSTKGQTLPILTSLLFCDRNKVFWVALGIFCHCFLSQNTSYLQNIPRYSRNLSLCQMRNYWNVTHWGVIFRLHWALMYMSNATFYSLDKFNSPCYNFLQNSKCKLTQGKPNAVINLFKNMCSSW